MDLFLKGTLFYELKPQLKAHIICNLRSGVATKDFSYFGLITM